MTHAKQPSATEVSEGLRDAAVLAEEGKLDAALVLVRGLQATLAQAELASAHVEVALAALCSARGEIESALVHADEAMRLEPENPGCRMAFDAVIEKSNAVLIASWPWNERGLLLFKVLASSGMASKELVALVMGSASAGASGKLSDVDAA